MRRITLPNGNSVSLKTYLASWRELKRIPPETEIKGWEWYPMKAGDILREISAGIQDRINQRIPYSERGKNNA